MWDLSAIIDERHLNECTEGHLKGTVFLDGTTFTSSDSLSGSLRNLIKQKKFIIVITDDEISNVSII
jgi:hypothetical protein